MLAYEVGVSLPLPVCPGAPPFLSPILQPFVCEKPNAPPRVHGLLTRAAAEVSNRLTSVQYDETTWSAQSWMAFAVQRISVALHSAVAHEAARVYNARAHAAAGDPRFGAGG